MTDDAHVPLALHSNGFELHVTEAAWVRMAKILEEEKSSHLAVRVALLGGGCSGFQYDFSLDVPEPDDHRFRHHTSAGIATLVVDPISAQYLQGAKLDFKSDLMGSQFVWSNPNAVGQCGCGQSISFKVAPV